MKVVLKHILRYSPGLFIFSCGVFYAYIKYPYQPPLPAADGKRIKPVDSVPVFGKGGMSHGGIKPVDSVPVFGKGGMSHGGFSN